MSPAAFQPGFDDAGASVRWWRRPATMTALRLCVSAGLLVYLAMQIEVRQSLAVLRHARPTLLTALLGVFLFERLFAAFRWHVLLRRRCPHVRLATAVRVTLVGSFLGSFLPGAVGSDAVRIYGLRRSACRMADVFTSVFVDRALGVLSLILLVFAGLSLGTQLLPDVIGWSALVCLGLLVGGCAAVVSPRLRAGGDRCLPRVLAGPLRPRLSRLYASLDAYQRARGLLAWGLLLALVMQMLRVGGTVLAARALHLDDVPVIDFVVFVPVIMFVLMIPISIGGLGVRETAFVRLFALVGVAAEAAVALLILIFLTELVAALPGAWLYARGFPPAAVPHPAPLEPGA